MLVYTFRTYPYREKLEEMFPEVFVFGSLKDDFEAFKLILQEHPSQILGVADTKGHSRIEPFAINKFNRGELEKDGPNQVTLFVDLKLDGVRQAKSPTNTFCNWTMYKIQRHIDIHKLQIDLSFVHINAEDIDRLKTLTD